MEMQTYFEMIFEELSNEFLPVVQVIVDTVISCLMDIEDDPIPLWEIRYGDGFSLHCEPGLGLGVCEIQLGFRRVGEGNVPLVPKCTFLRVRTQLPQQETRLQGAVKRVSTRSKNQRE